MNFSNDLVVSGSIFLGQLDGTTKGHMDWKSVGEGDWNTQSGWELNIVLNKLEGLLVVEWHAVQQLGKELYFSFCKIDMS